MNSDDVVYNPNVLSLLSEEAAAAPETSETTGDETVTEDAAAPATADSAYAFSGSNGSAGNANNANKLAESSNTVDKNNKAADKALQNAASVVPDAQSAQVKRAANIWIWLVLTIIVLSAVSLIFLRKTRRKPRTAKQAAKAQLKSRW